MPFPLEDRPDPTENMPAMRARIPDHIARGEISTGVIVVTGGTEYVLDFVRNLPRPNAIVARVVLPHMVMPQFIDALAANVELFRNRYGELPGGPPAPISFVPTPGSAGGPGSALVSPEMNSVDILHGTPVVTPPSTDTKPDANASEGAGAAGIAQGGGQTAGPTPNQPTGTASQPAGPGGTHGNVPEGPPPAANPNLLKRQNPQEVYDDLKLRDEILSGAYANAVMIGHGPYEFSFDFITNFYPQSAVSCRVYLASGHILRLLDSLRASWDQLRPRLNQPFPPNPPPPRNQG